MYRNWEFPKGGKKNTTKDPRDFNTAWSASYLPNRWRTKIGTKPTNPNQTSYPIRKNFQRKSTNNPSINWIISIKPNQKQVKDAKAGESPNEVSLIWMGVNQIASKIQETRKLNKKFTHTQGDSLWDETKAGETDRRAAPNPRRFHASRARSKRPSGGAHRPPRFSGFVEWWVAWSRHFLDEESDSSW